MTLSHLQQSRKLGGNRGFTIVEVAIAGAILAVFLSGIYECNWRALALLKSGVEGTSVARLLQNRVEQVRTYTWTQITDPTFISGTILAATTSSGDLGSLTEKIDVNQYPLPNGYSQGQTLSSTIEVTRSANGTVTTTSSGDGTMPYYNTVRVDVTATWSTTFNSKQHTRTMSTVISQGGILGRNQ